MLSETLKPVHLAVSNFAYAGLLDLVRYLSAAGLRWGSFSVSTAASDRFFGFPTPKPGNPLPQSTKSSEIHSFNASENVEFC